VLVATGDGADTAGTDTAEQDESRYLVTEVATFRSDGAYSDGRHPDAVRYTISAVEDVRRRDFTINGLLLDPDRLFPQGLKPGFIAAFAARLKSCPDTKQFQSNLSEQFQGNLPGQFHKNLRAAVIDHVGGLADLEAGIVRAIGQPELRFEEDHLRMLRAVRFAARFGFELTPQRLPPCDDWHQKSTLSAVSEYATS